ncbi:hypothetical protein ACSEXT_12235 [Lactiplantibacillus plantarum]
MKKKLMYGAIALLLVFIGMVLATPSSNDSKENAASTKHSAKQSSRVSKYITYESSSSADEKRIQKFRLNIVPRFVVLKHTLAI